MSFKAQITGQLNLVNETTNANFLSFDLATLFGSITGITEHNFIERKLVDTDGVVALGMGGVSTIKGFMIAVEGSGSVTVKHDSNTNGVEITSGMVFFGNFSSITIETASTQEITVKYFMFE